MTSVTVTATRPASGVTTFTARSTTARIDAVEVRRMDSWQVALLVVASLLVGVAIPVLVQLSLALRAMRVAVERVGDRADRALLAATTAVERLDRVAAKLEDQGRIEAFLEAVGSLSRTIQQLQDTARVASAVGAAIAPAVGAAVRAWREHREGGAPEEGSNGGSGTIHEGQEEPS
jgi:hypothetical protein